MSDIHIWHHEKKWTHHTEESWQLVQTQLVGETTRGPLVWSLTNSIMRPGCCRWNVTHNVHFASERCMISNVSQRVDGSEVFAQPRAHWQTIPLKLFQLWNQIRLIRPGRRRTAEQTLGCSNLVIIRCTATTPRLRNQDLQHTKANLSVSGASFFFLSSFPVRFLLILLVPSASLLFFFLPLSFIRRPAVAVFLRRAVV